jgi:hypothetical protein
MYSSSYTTPRGARAARRTTLKKRLESGALPLRRGFKKSHDESDCRGLTKIMYIHSKKAAIAKKYADHEFTVKPRNLNLEL